MSMSMGQSRGGGRGRRRRSKKNQVMSEINVTPFVDVMLVLLIVFMVTAPLLVFGVPIDLPETVAGPSDSISEPISIAVEADGRIILQSSEILFEDLIPKLTAIAEAKNGFKERIHFRGAKNALYGDVLKVLALIHTSGYRRLFLESLQVELKLQEQQ